MPESGIDPHTLYRNVVHILEHGLRTATYKLATMTALIDFSVAHRSTFPANTLDVPIPDLARRVMDLYWRQSRPFDGAQLRQSTGRGHAFLTPSTSCATLRTRPISK